MIRDDCIQSLQVVINMAKAWSQAGNVLTRVRHISESDDQTLARVVDDYERLCAILCDYANPHERQQLAARYRGCAAELLTRILQRAEHDPLVRVAATRLTP